MSIAIDIICVVVILLTIGAYAKKGFFKSVINIVAYIVAVAGAIVLKPFFLSFFESMGLTSSLKGTVESLFQSTSEAAERLTLDAALSKVAMPDSLKDMLFPGTEGEILSQELCDGVFNFCMNGIAVFAGFILISLVLRIVIHFIKGKDDLPTFGVPDRILGGVLGAVIGAVYVYFALVFIYVLSSTGNLTEVAAAVENTYVAKFIYEYCPLTFMTIVNKVS